MASQRVAINTKLRLILISNHLRLARREHSVVFKGGYCQGLPDVIRPSFQAIRNSDSEKPPVNRKPPARARKRPLARIFVPVHRFTTK